MIASAAGPGPERELSVDWLDPGAGELAQRGLEQRLLAAQPAVEVAQQLLVQVPFGVGLEDEPFELLVGLFPAPGPVAE